MLTHKRLPAEVRRAAVLAVTAAEHLKGARASWNLRTHDKKVAKDMGKSDSVLAAKSALRETLKILDHSIRCRSL